VEYEKQLAAHETTIPGVIMFDLSVHGDNRGWFKENWQRAKMSALGLPDFGPVQNNVSYNEDRGATRGIHAEPWDKLISVATGEIFGAWVDLRPGETFGRVFTCRLDPSRAIYVPRGVGNAYQALEDGTVYTYLVNAHWSVEQKRSYTFVNLADPTLAIDWPIPLETSIRSDADLTHPLLADAHAMEPRRTLVVGSHGQLGRALQKEAAHRGLVGWEFHDVDTFDLCDPTSYEGIDWDTYGTIINAAAFTAVDAAETPKGRAAAWKVNVEGVKQLARVAQEHRLTLVHMSSDYVFDGVAEEHDEDEGFTPLGVYGQTKAAADAIVSLVPHHYIVRSSWVIGDGRNFVRTMMALSRRVAAGELEQVTVVDDQRGRLTFTDEMAHAILWLLGYREGADMVDDRSPYATYGTYNLTGSGRIASWAEIAAEVFDLTCANGERVVPVSTEAYYAQATEPVSPRPAQSALCLNKIRASGFSPADWEESLRRYVAAELVGEPSKK
jgi:dTDP-4-dehydrorhamnose 3,5-epimerase